MGRIKKYLLATLFSGALVAGAATPAHAVTWHDWSRGCGTFFTLVCDVEYTGSYPDGIVRGWGQRNVYEVMLQTQVGNGSWIMVAHTYPQDNGGNFVTGTVKAGRDNSYRTCLRTVRNGPALCDAPQGPIYLGD